MSPYLYRRLMREKLARQRAPRASHKYGAHSVSLLALNPVSAGEPRHAR
jgi:hypothetical protein